MAKFIFTIPGRPVVYGPRRDEFIWVEGLQAFVYKGKPVFPSQFNATFKAVFQRYRDQGVEIQFFDDGPPTHEELVSDAIVTLRQLAPDALRPKYQKTKAETQPAEAAAV